MLSYDPETGILRWKVERYRKHAGDIAGCKYITKRKKMKRVNISVNYYRYGAYRVIWFLMTGSWPTKEIDHIDGDGWNNRWSNLREVTHRENGKNLKIKNTNTTGVAGVSLAKNKRKFRSRIMVDYKEIYLGVFDTVEEAATVRKKAEKKYYGEFARNA